MIANFGDLTFEERGFLAYDARTTAHGYEDPRYHRLTAEERQAKVARWNEIAEAIETSGYQPLPNAGTGGPC